MPRVGLLGGATTSIEGSSPATTAISRRRIWNCWRPVRETDPSVLLRGPSHGGRRRKARLGEAADRDRNLIGTGAGAPDDRRTAGRTKARLERERAARSAEPLALSVEADLPFRKIRRYAEDAAGAALAVEAVAGEDEIRFALNRDPELPAGACRRPLHAASLLASSARGNMTGLRPVGRFRAAERCGWGSGLHPRLRRPAGMA
jgi:hypothetical protein